MTTAKRILLSLLSFILIVVSVCPSFAYAAESYNIPFSQPQVVDGSGYMEVLFERPSDGYRYIRLYQWQTSTSSTDNNADLNVPLFLTVNKNGFIQFLFSSSYSNIFYSAITIYDPRFDDSCYFEAWQDMSNNGAVVRSLDYDDNIVSFNIYGSYADLTSNLLDTYIPSFTVSYGDDTTLSDILESLAIINDKLLQLHNDNVITYDELTDITSKLSDLYSYLSSEIDLLNQNVYNIASNIVYITQQLNDFSDRMHDDLTDLLDRLMYILWELREYLPLIDLDLLDILDENISSNEKLDRIIEILEMQGQSVQTTVDSSNIDDAIDIENSLLDNSNVDVSNVVNVEVNQNALTVIWDLVEKFLNSHGKVFGMVLTVLSLGLVAMILGRKV